MVETFFLWPTIFHNSQRRFQNTDKHPRWSIVRRELTAFSCELFLQQATSLVFGRVLNTPLINAIDSHFWFLWNWQRCIFNLNHVLLLYKLYAYHSRTYERRRLFFYAMWLETLKTREHYYWNPAPYLRFSKENNNL